MSLKKQEADRAKTISFSIPPELLLRVDERVNQFDSRSRVLCELIIAGLEVKHERT